jgi:hypothetical protein
MPKNDSAPHHSLDLYRTTHDQFEPNSSSSPYTSCRALAVYQGFTEVVLLHCAALTEKEADYPPYFTHGNNALQIRGASLQWYNRFNTETRGENRIAIDVDLIALLYYHTPPCDRNRASCDARTEST